MFARTTRSIAAPLRNLTSTPALRRLPHSRAQFFPRARFASTQGPNESRPEGSLNIKTFYKTFARPIFKTSLLAIFIYQVIYYFWVRLEQNEIRDETQAMIDDLEARISQLEKAREQQKK